MSNTRPIADLRAALPFWSSLALVPLLYLAATRGGWALCLPILATLVVIPLLDWITGENMADADPNTPPEQLYWYRLITLLWFPVQLVTIFTTIWYVTHSTHLSTIEMIVLFFGVGQISGVVGIVYGHELIHQDNRVERWLGDLLLGLALYGHFRTEHLLVHHRYVGTARDAVTARYNEHFHRFFPRVLIQSWRSAFMAERELLARNALPWWHRSNPFWRYWALKLLFIAVAALIGGGLGVALFAFQALVAIWHLELTDYIEHYGLTRKHLGDGKYERILPQHSWNSSQRVSNWLLINLQRHSDHHMKPSRRFPLLQNHTETDAPQLPFGYPIMVVAALIPPIWLRMMNPKVRQWRAKYYPEVTDWLPYKNGTNPMPK